MYVRISNPSGLPTLTSAKKKEKKNTNPNSNSNNMRPDLVHFEKLLLWTRKVGNTGNPLA